MENEVTKTYPKHPKETLNEATPLLHPTRWRKARTNCVKRFKPATLS